MMNFSSPSFPIGPQVTQRFITILREAFGTSDRYLAEQIGAPHDHPFFLVDVTLARLYESASADISHLSQLGFLHERQRLNVQMAVAERDRAELASAGVIPSDLAAYIPIAERLEGCGVGPVDLVFLKRILRWSQIEDLVDALAGADCPSPEKVIWQCSEAGVDPFSASLEEVEETLRKVLSQGPPKEVSTGQQESELWAGKSQPS
jgi:hypothetical protein